MKQTKPNHVKIKQADTVTGEYSAESYRVFVGAEEVYCAGNSPNDSQVYLSARDGVGLRKMRQFCETTCKQIAAEKRLKFAGVSRIDPD